MNNNEGNVEIQYGECDYKCANFLKNGDFVTFMSNSSFSIYPVIFIYTLLSKNKWTCKYVYKLNEKDIIFGDIVNDKMWMLAYNLMFLLDLSTFQFQTFSLFVSMFFFITRVYTYYYYYK